MLQYWPILLLNTFLTFIVLKSAESTRRKIFTSLAVWFIPFWGPIVVLFSIGSLSPALRLALSIAFNAMLGFAFVIFAGAAAGNSNQGQYFGNRVLPVEIGLFATLCIVSVLLLLVGRTKWAIGLPFATIPLLTAGLAIVPAPQY